MSFSPEKLHAQLASFPTTPCYWVAYSGGCDSHVLLHALAQVRHQLKADVRAVHINHGLCEQADAWSRHCHAVCQALSISLTAIDVDALPGEGESPEAVARRARYQALASVIGMGEALLLAQHQNDQCETVLLQLLRGTGPKGLAAMPSSKAPFAKGWLGRPLLPFTRDNLMHYAQQQQLSWIDDPSNLDTDYDRNYLRRQVMPHLQHRWPSLASTISRTAAHQAEAAALLDVLARQDWEAVQGPSNDTLFVTALRTLDPPRQRNVLRYWLAEQCHLPLPDSRRLNRILSEVIPAVPDARPIVNWPGGEVRRFAQKLFALAPATVEGLNQPIVWNLSHKIQIGNGTRYLQCEPVKGQGLKASLAGRDDVCIRFRRGGEVCRPYKRGHRHQLKKLFQEWQVPPWQRDRVPLLYVGNEIAHVVGFCICEPFQAEKGEDGLNIVEVQV